MPHDPLADFDAQIVDFLEAAGVNRELIQLSTPTDRTFGERGTNVAFLLARERRQAPSQIADEIAATFRPGPYRFIAGVESAGKGFVNFRLDYAEFVPHVIEQVRRSGKEYGRQPEARPGRVVVEHTSVNPNKEWHIGHVRNAILGDVVARVLRLAGQEVQVQNYIDDTGLQAAQAIVGLRDFPEPQRLGEKYDHYVGRLYVKIAAELGNERQMKEELRELREKVQRDGETEEIARRIASLEARLENLHPLQQRVMNAMRDLEEGECHTVIGDILNAQLETAYRLGVFYDMLAWESHLVQSQLFDLAISELKKSPRVYVPREGHYADALVMEMEQAPRPGEEPKSEVLIRKTGIPTYVAKDIAYHMWKTGALPDRLHYEEYLTQPNGRPLMTTALSGRPPEDRAPDTVINVIAVNQSQAQESVKEALGLGGFPEAAAKLYHLAYGLVSTEAGRISGRKGTSVSGDSVIDEAVRVAYERVTEKRSQDLTESEMREIAEAVGIGAVRYLMVQYNPMREIVFDVNDVVSFDGNTGLYVQYALVRMYAILRKALSDFGIDEAAIDSADPSLLVHEQERRLAYHLAAFPSTIATASRTLSVNLVAEYAFDLATIFSQFYRDCSVLGAEPDVRLARLLLVRTVRDALAGVADVLGLPVIERL